MELKTIDIPTAKKIMEEEYFPDLLENGNFSEHTARSYRRYISRFLDFLTKEFAKTIDEINASTIRKFSHIKTDKGGIYKNSSKVAIFAAIDNFYSWLYAEEVISANWYRQSIKRKKSGRGGRSGIEKRLPPFLTEDEVETLFYSILCKDNFATTRNLALVAFMMNAGPRADELGRVSIGDIETLLSTGEIQIIGKGNYQRRIRPMKDNIGYIEDYLKLRKKSCKSIDEPFFLSSRGNALKQSTLHTTIKQILTEAGIDLKSKGQSGSHLMRHSAASKLYRETRDIKAVSVFLGHESVKTTEIYVH